MKKQAVILSLILLFAINPVYGQNFSVQLKNGTQLFFNITDTLGKTVELSFPKTFGGVITSKPSGKLELPSTVIFKDVTYKVTSIGEKAFSGSNELTFVSIPSSVTHIGSQAFSHCDNLEGVVLPAQEPSFGESVFHSCTSLRTVSLGSDWKSVDLSLFSASDSLETVWIPAKVRKITNVKSLGHLKSIHVDPNNPFFVSKLGLLYSRDEKTLLSCPCAKDGFLFIPDGTEHIFSGAFSGCSKLVGLSLPSSTHEFSFLEFYECSSLTRLEIFSEVPPLTARWNGALVFALCISNAQAQVFVPSSAFSQYLYAICDKEGMYESLDGRFPNRNYTSEELIGKKRILRIKAKP